MSPVGKAIWFIETHFAGDLSLDEIAKAAGVSRYHLVHAFGFATGQSVMRYVRGRRLTEAARSLAGGAPDILAVALDAGYGSHEAFTRAFRDQFGLTPEAARARRALDNIETRGAHQNGRNAHRRSQTRALRERQIVAHCRVGRALHT
jgi:AraC family transcriptional regulator